MSLVDESHRGLIIFPGCCRCFPPGKLASVYEGILASGYCAKRRVFYVGKPHSLVYEEAQRLLAEANGG
jgi:ribonucleotide monophosphatase NagD (HAD superfamily)